MLLRHEDLSNAFDTLIDFPGLWRGLEPGNFQRMLALRCDEVSFTITFYKRQLDLYGIGDPSVYLPY
jgi:hypothetical protein